MKKEENCSRFIISALISGMVLFTTAGFAFAPEVSGTFRPGNKTAYIKVASNDLQGKICQASIQNQIEWDYKGNRKWAKRNLEKICKNAEFSLQPGTCFNRIMHGSIDHGGGTRWKWQDALKLCASTKNSTATINCFSEEIKRKAALPRAIEQCRIKP